MKNNLPLILLLLVAPVASGKIAQSEPENWESHDSGTETDDNPSFFILENALDDGESSADGSYGDLEGGPGCNCSALGKITPLGSIKLLKRLFF